MNPWKVAWEEYVGQFDTFGDEWQDKGADQVFKAGYEAGLLAATAKHSRPGKPLPLRFTKSSVVDPDAEPGYRVIRREAASERTKWIYRIDMGERGKAPPRFYLWAKLPSHPSWRSICTYDGHGIREAIKDARKFDKDLAAYRMKYGELSNG